MKYMLMIYTGTSMDEWEKRPEEERNAISQEYFAIRDDQRVTGGDQLQPGATATTVRVADGRTLTTDGPFAETKEELGGYYLMEADDLDSALEVAARIPAARLGGAIEVRPVVEH